MTFPALSIPEERRSGKLRPLKTAPLVSGHNETMFGTPSANDVKVKALKQMKQMSRHSPMLETPSKKQKIVGYDSHTPLLKHALDLQLNGPDSPLVGKLNISKSAKSMKTFARPQISLDVKPLMSGDKKTLSRISISEKMASGDSLGLSASDDMTTSLEQGENPFVADYVQRSKSNFVR